MDKIETIDDFKKFLKAHRDLLKDNVVKISDLPADDEWIKDDEWDKIYECEIERRKNN